MFKNLGNYHITSECPTRKTLFLKDNGQLTSESEQESVSGSEEENVSNSGAPEGDLHMIKRALSAHPRDQTQWESIFYASCHVEGKLCSVIIDGGSCTNGAVTGTVRKFGMETRPHPHPYQLQWRNE